jgi:hypothetical protein
VGGPCCRFLPSASVPHLFCTFCALDSLWTFCPGTKWIIIIIIIVIIIIFISLFITIVRSVCVCVCVYAFACLLADDYKLNPKTFGNLIGCETEQPFTWWLACPTCAKLRWSFINRIAVATKLSEILIEWDWNGYYNTTLFMLYNKDQIDKVQMWRTTIIIPHYLGNFDIRIIYYL